MLPKGRAKEYQGYDFWKEHKIDLWERGEVNRGVLFRFAKLVEDSWNKTIEQYV